MHLSEEENLTGVVLLIATGFTRYFFVATYYFEQVIFIKVETVEQSIRSVQSTGIKKSTEYHKHCKPI